MRHREFGGFFWFFFGFFSFFSSGPETPLRETRRIGPYMAENAPA